MAAPDDLLYEYGVIRYMPRVDREEFVNIGLIMMNKRHRWLKAMVLYDESRLRALYPKADLECLKKQSRLFELNDVPGKDLPVEEKYRWLTAAKSACLQVSPSHPGLLTLDKITADKNHTDLSHIDKSLQDKDLVDTNPIDKSKIDISSAMEREFSRLFSLLIL